MTRPQDISIDDYTYDLPEEKIAAHPLSERDQSKLLIYKNEKISEDVYKNIADHIPENALLIFNNTKVIPARILFKKDTGGMIEIFCLEPFEENNEYTTVMSKTGSAKWKCMIGGANKWKSRFLEKKISINNNDITVRVDLHAKLSDAYVVEFSWQPSHFTFSEIIEQSGQIPLPPYIKRDVVADDKERYQTIYAEFKGSVAAPTAGLHFTENVFSSLQNKNIKHAFVTLHVGAGTFKPVKALSMRDHEMHAEWLNVSICTIENILRSQNVIAVGTTSLRTIESLYWMGVKIYNNDNCNTEDLEIKQWDVYEYSSDHLINKITALNALVKWMKKKNLQTIFTRTHILIASGYTFKIANGLVTNFHQPRSTLLLLVAAITKDWKKIYDHALHNNYRFLSYGDGCLIYF